MGRMRLAALSALACALAFSGNASGAVPNGPSPDLVISQIYGGGGNAGATYRQDFIEIFNRGSSSVPLAGRSLQYTSATGTGNFGANSAQLTELPDVFLGPGQYFLVRQAAGTGGTEDVPADHVDPTPIPMSGTAGKVALVEGTTSLGCNTAASCAANGNDTRIIDLVGYGNANYFEGVAAAPTLSNTTAAFRNGGGCQDSDVNGADFVAAAPNPRTSATPTNFCTGDQAPFVAATTPPDEATDVSTDSNVTITFSEPVTAGPNAFGFSCNGEAVAFTVSPSGSSTTYVLTPSSPLPRGADCTVTVEGDQISDLDELDPPDTGADYFFSFSTQGLTGLRIHDIQGRQHLSPYRGMLVSGVPGIVTARRANGFYYQDPQPDNDPRTSEGMFVFTGAAPPTVVVVGAPVTVSGRVSEFRAGGSSGLGNLTLTEIVSPVVTAGTQIGTIEPTVVGAGGRVPPRVVIDNDTPDPAVDDPPLVSGDVESKSSPPGVTEPQDPTFDPAQDGIDFHESLEGMLVQINRAVAVSPTESFGTNSEIAVLADNGASASVRTVRGGIIVRSLDFFLPHEYRRGDFNPERLILNDPILREQGVAAPLVNVRDTFTQPVLAVVDYSFGNFKYLMLNNPPAASGGLQPEVARAPRSDELSIATYNVENLDPVNDGPRMVLIARQIIDNLRSPDLIALVEMQDLDGEGPFGPTGDPTFAALSDAVVAAGGPRYGWRQIDPVHNADGGAPNGNIRVGFFFRTDRGLSFVDQPGGTAFTATEDNPALPGAQLTFSPGRIDPNNPVWTNSRKPLAGEFLWRGRKLFVVANHFNSKGGDQPLIGRFQEPMRPSELQRRGSAFPAEDPVRGQAGVVNAWVRRLLTADPRANVVVLGDLNDFHFSETNRVLEWGGNFSVELVDLYHFLPVADRYSYVFQGNSQDLDHVLVSASLLLRGRPTLDPVHINAEFSNNVSDHDSLLVRLTLRGADDDDDDDED